MPFLSLVSTRGDTNQALTDIMGQVRNAWTGAVDVAFIFFTPQHLAAIVEHGPCAIHRRSFAPFRPTQAELL